MLKNLAKIALVTVVATTLGLVAIEPSSASEDYDDVPPPTKPSCSGGCHGS